MGFASGGGIWDGRRSWVVCLIRSMRYSGRDRNAEHRCRGSRMAHAVADRDRDAGRAGEAQEAEGEIAQTRHELRRVSRPDLRAVLIERHVADPVHLVLDAPVVARETKQPLAVRGLPGKARHSEANVGSLIRAVEVADGGFDPEDLAGMGKVYVLTRSDPSRGPDLACLDTPVTPAFFYVRRGKKTPNPCSQSTGAAWAGCSSQ